MYVRNREPSIDDLLSDPVTQLVMERDGLSIETVRALFAETKQRLDAVPAQAGDVPTTSR